MTQKTETSKKSSDLWSRNNKKDVSEDLFCKKPSYKEKDSFEAPNLQHTESTPSEYKK